MTFVLLGTLDPHFSSGIRSQISIDPAPKQDEFLRQAQLAEMLIKARFRSVDFPILQAFFQSGISNPL
jgi:hypothetical protein